MRSVEPFTLEDHASSMVNIFQGRLDDYLAKDLKGISKEVLTLSPTKPLVGLRFTNYTK